MNKNLPKSLKYISLSSKYWTRVLFLKGRDLHLPFVSIGRVDIEILADKTCTVIVKLFRQPMRKTYKGTPSDEHILGIRKETRSRVLSLLTISKAKNKLRYCQQLTKEFCTNS